MVAGHLQAFSQCSSYHCSLSAKSAAPFFTHPPTPSARSSGWEWGWPARSLQTADSQIVRMLSKMLKKHSNRSCGFLAHSKLLFLCLLVRHFGHPFGRLLWELKILVKSGVNRSSWHIMGLSKFHDTLLTINLHFGSDIGNGSLGGEISRGGTSVSSSDVLLFW